VLIDSQGTGDNRNSDVKLDTLIMYICLQISSCQLININTYLRSEELKSLEVNLKLLHFPMDYYSNWFD